MNGLSDSLTIGLVLSLIFGALFFYLYTRIGQVEKRVSLTENILLDLKMAHENTMMSMSAPAPSHMMHHADVEVEESQPQQLEELPLEKQGLEAEAEEIVDDDFYKSVLEQATTQPVQEITPVKMEANYESMTLKELKSLAKQKGLNVSQLTHKKDIIEALKKKEQKSSILEPVPGSDGILEEGFPVELGSN
jgi:hypothetical protein